jgi:hypothetical protein
MVRRTVKRGSSEANGSWKTICAWRRNAVSPAPRSSSTGLAAKKTAPEVGSISRIRQRATVVLPQPLSPTMPSASPGAISRSSASTARTCR